MKYRLGAWLLVVGFVGCSSPTPSTSSSSNWVFCHSLNDCARAPGAVACTGGYCVDSHGERIPENASGGSSGGGGATDGGVSTGGAHSGGGAGVSTGGVSGGGSGGFTTGGSHSGGAAGASGGSDSGIFTSCAACAAGYFCFRWNNSAFVTCRPLNGSCDAAATCECACPDIRAGDCGAGTTACACTETNGTVEVHCSGA